MTDTDASHVPQHEKDTGVELVFVFTMPALILVVGIATMAITGHWWLMGVTFVGELLVTGVVARALIQLTDSGETAGVAWRMRIPRRRTPTGIPSGHRLHWPHGLALHH